MIFVIIMCERYFLLNDRKYQFILYFYLFFKHLKHKIHFSKHFTLKIQIFMYRLLIRKMTQLKK